MAGMMVEVFCSVLIEVSPSASGSTSSTGAVEVVAPSGLWGVGVLLCVWYTLKIAERVCRQDAAREPEDSGWEVFSYLNVQLLGRLSVLVPRHLNAQHGGISREPVRSRFSLAESRYRQGSRVETSLLYQLWTGITGQSSLL
jgi:hypothetical protein